MKKEKWSMVIDLDLCTGCNACTIACRQENNIPFVDEDQFELGRAIRWNELIPILEEEYPSREGAVIPRNCGQCENPPCIKVCPVKATFINEEGLVGQIYYRCIGCRYCTVACPYTVRYFNWYDYTERNVPVEMHAAHNPDVTVRMVGVVEKCSYCYQRIREARVWARIDDREIEDGEIQTACQQVCPANAIIFGDVSDEKNQVAKHKRSARAFVLLEDLGTKPKTIYLHDRKGDGLYE